MISTVFRRNIQAIASKNAPVFTTKRNFAKASEAAPMNGTVVAKNGTVRPISPDLQIWKFSPAAYLHVGVRISGVALSAGFAGVGLYGLCGSCDIPAMLDSIKLSAPFFTPVMKMLIATPLVYHTLGGLRQMYQDRTAKGYNHTFHEQSSYAMAMATLVVSLYLAFYYY